MFHYYSMYAYTYLMIPVNKRYQYRIGITKVFYHMIDHSSLKSQCFPIWPIAQKTWKAELGGDLEDTENTHGALRGSSRSAVMTLTNMYKWCHALILYQQLCLGLDERERKKKWGELKRRGPGCVWNSHARLPPYSKHLQMWFKNHRKGQVLENLVMARESSS